MHRRKWDSGSKFKIILEGLRGKNVAQICNDHQISQSQYYKWKDQFMAHGQKAFDVLVTSKKEDRLVDEVKSLKSLIGELTVELKKSDNVW